CLRGCYRCVLSYGNQTFHERIDRRAAIPTLRALTSARTVPAEPPTDTAERNDEKPPVATDGRAVELESWLRAAKLRMPTDADTTLEDTKVDLVYDQVSPPAAIIFEDGHTRRDTTGLVFAG